MCAVDIQQVNVFVNMLYRKEIKDKHKIAIEKWERHSVVAYPQFLSYSRQPCKHTYVQIKYLYLYKSNYLFLVFASVRSVNFSKCRAN